MISSVKTWIRRVRRVTVLQGLLTDYFRGRLSDEGHALAGQVPAQNGARANVARAIDALRWIDFEAVFDPDAADRYRPTSGPRRLALDDFARVLGGLTPSVATLAEARQDYVSLLEEALLAVHPLRDRASRGKVQTDPELAQVLAALTMDRPGIVLDPCCGDGPLLVAAVDRCTPR